MDFDQHAESYRKTLDKTLGAFGAEADQLASYKAKLILDLLARRFGDPGRLRILDVGCGIGLIDRVLAPHVGELHGTDPSSKSIEEAASRTKTAHFKPLDGTRIPHADESFDFVFSSCVLHHVGVPERSAFVGELSRVTRRDGGVLVLEHNPLNPLTRYVVSHCPFDADAVLLFNGTCVALLRQAGLMPVDSRYITFWPRRSQLVERVEAWLGWLPLGAQYYVFATRPS